MYWFESPRLLPDGDIISIHWLSRTLMMHVIPESPSSSRDHENVDQILRQLNKLIDVVHAIQHGSETSVDREMALFKVEVKPEKRGEVFQVIDVFRAKTVDITDESIIIETTGSSSKIDALERMLSSVGLLEMVRSGKLMMARGLEPT